jgi:hypothetical protein
MPDSAEESQKAHPTQIRPHDLGPSSRINVAPVHGWRHRYKTVGDGGGDTSAGPRRNPRTRCEDSFVWLWGGDQSANSPCPSCGVASGRVHSRYQRRLADLPIAGRRVVLMLRARRFRCAAVLCGRRIFAERFGADVLEPWARRTARLDQIVHCLALALGGRPAASFTHRLSMPVSNDTLLRAVGRRGGPSFAPPAIIGIDDWAWRRNHRYGTLICHL